MVEQHVPVPGLHMKCRFLDSPVNDLTGHENIHFHCTTCTSQVRNEHLMVKVMSCDFSLYFLANDGLSRRSPNAAVHVRQEPLTGCGQAGGEG